MARKTDSMREGGYGKVDLVGMPNVGKSVIFGLLTGKYATVSNYPGTTVEVFQGNIELDGKRFTVVDAPGVNSLLPMSEDERVTRDILLLERPALVLQVGDMKNLKRTLSITAQLAEMCLPVALNLNMEDEAMDRGITVDKGRLSAYLGIEVTSTVAPERAGLRELRASIVKGGSVPTMQVKYHPLIEEYAEEMTFLMPDANISKRALALMVLSGDESLRGWLDSRLSMSVLKQIDALRDTLQKKIEKPVGALINEARMRVATEIADAVTERASETKSTILSEFGRLSMHPLWGIVILLGVLYFMYLFVGRLGADILVGLLEKTIFGEYLNPMFTAVVNHIVPIAIVREMLVGEYGLITMAITYAIGIVLPITTTFFIAFSVLEDSGYLPRLAIVSDRMFSRIGLSGKAVLPMVLGLGCGTMAVMTTRILDTRRERMIATFLLALAVPCAAQLGVIMGLLGGISGAAVALWLIIMLLIMFLAGYLAAQILPGKKAEFFLEIPPMRTPSIKNIAMKTYNRAVWYLREAVPLFMLGTFALFMLDKLSLLAVIERASAPVMTGILGLPEQAAKAFLIGFFRRDYGAAGLYAMAKDGLLSPVQVLVSLVTLTLFIPCVAHFMMMVKERGLRGSLIMAGIIVPLAITVGGILNFVMRALGIAL